MYDGLKRVERGIGSSGMRSAAFVSVISCLVVSGCVTTAKIFPAKVVKSDGNLHVLEYRTGTALGGASLYDEYFKAAAAEACKGSRYAVTEKAHVPTIFKFAEGVLDPEKFYWVIKCEGK